MRNSRLRMPLKLWLRSTEKGLSLPEVLVIVGLAMLLAAAVLPRVLGSRIAANEASTIANLDNITSAQEAYKTAYPSIGYSDSLSHLALVCGQRDCNPTPEHACLIDCKLPQATTKGQYGYMYGLSTSAPAPRASRDQYVIAAAPVWFRRTGDHDYCAIEDGRIRFRVSKSATAAGLIDHSMCGRFAVLP